MAVITHLHLRQQAHTIASELDDFLADAERRRGLSVNTIKSYRCDLQTAAAALSGPLDMIATTDVDSFLMGRDEKPSTTNRRIASLSRFFLWAMKQGYCTRNPIDLVETKSDTEHLPRPIRTKAELKALDSAITQAPQPYRLILTVLRETGMRADEVLSLNVGDVVLDAGREGLRICEAKNGHERVVVLTPDLMPKSLRSLRAWLRDLADATPTVPLFRSNRGTRVSYDALHYQWVQVCESAHLVDTINEKRQLRYTLHQLRHTVGSTLITHYPEQIVSRMLGHRDPRSTRRYTEVTEEQVRVALAQKQRLP